MTSLTEEFAATDPVVDEEGASLQVNDAPIPEEVAQEEQADPSVTPDEQLNLDDPHDIEAARQAAFERGAQVIADTQGRETTARDNAIIGAAFDQAVETAGEQQAVWGMDMFMSIFQQFFGAIMGNDGSMEGLDFGNIFGGLFTPSDGHDHGSPPISGNGSYEGSGATISLEHPIKDYSGGAGHNIGWVARRGRVHEGRDYAAPHSTDVYAAAEGEVIAVGRANGYGNYIDIQHPGGIITRYAHIPNGSAQVAVGDRVTSDTQIAEVGSTGRSSGPHLHFEVGIRDANGNWQIVDPEEAMAAGSSIGNPATQAELIGDASRDYAHRASSQGLNMAPA